VYLLPLRLIHIHQLLLHRVVLEQHHQGVLCVYVCVCVCTCLYMCVIVSVLLENGGGPESSGHGVARV
jgi:hypothetical protein